MRSRLLRRSPVGVLPLLAVLALSGSAGAQYTSAQVVGFDALDLGVAEQQQPQWCWAATIQAVLLYYGVERSQSDIVRATYGTIVNLPAKSPQQLYHTLNNFHVNGDRIEVVRGNFGHGSSLTAPLLYAMLRANQPIIAWFQNSPSSGHAVVIFSATFDRYGLPVQVGIFDPWPGRGIEAISPQPFGSLIREFFVVRAASIKKSGTPGGDGAPADSDDADQEFDKCMAKEPGKCRKVCRDDYGGTPAQCAVVCDPQSPVNIKSWESVCRDKPRIEEE